MARSTSASARAWKRARVSAGCFDRGGSSRPKLSGARSCAASHWEALIPATSAAARWLEATRACWSSRRRIQPSSRVGKPKQPRWLTPPGLSAFRLPAFCAGFAKRAHSLGSAGDSLWRGWARPPGVAWQRSEPSRTETSRRSKRGSASSLCPHPRGERGTACSPRNARHH